MPDEVDILPIVHQDAIQRGVRGRNDGVKILGRGEIAHALTVHAHAFSESAKAKIEKAGGKAVVIEPSKAAAIG